MISWCVSLRSLDVRAIPVMEDAELCRHTHAYDSGDCIKTSHVGSYAVHQCPPAVQCHLIVILVLRQTHQLRKPWDQPP